MANPTSPFCASIARQRLQRYCTFLSTCVVQLCPRHGASFGGTSLSLALCVRIYISRFRGFINPAACRCFVVAAVSLRHSKQWPPSPSRLFAHLQNSVAGLNTSRRAILLHLLHLRSIMESPPFYVWYPAGCPHRRQNSLFVPFMVSR